MKLCRSVCILLFFLHTHLLSEKHNLLADDWPHWMGPTRDGVWREKGILEKFPEGGPKVVWRRQIGPGYSGPSVSKNRLYVMDRTKDEGKGQKVENALRRAGVIPGRERVLCLEAETGKVVWSHSYDCPYKIAYPTGPRCTPTVDDRYVFTLGGMGHLICFQADKGKIIWQKDLMIEFKTQPPPWGYSAHPYVDKEKLIVPIGGEGSGIVAFDKHTGNEIWRSVTTPDIGYASPVIFEREGTRQLIFWHSESVDSLDPETGKVNWSVKFPEEKNPSRTPICTPRIIGNKLLISEFYKGSLLLEVGSKPPSVKELWRSSKIDRRMRTSLNSLMTTPVVKNGYAYAVANDPRGNGIFRCIDLKTGKAKWTNKNWINTKNAAFASAFLVENDGRYFMFNDIGELTIIKLSPDGYQELDRTALLEPTTSARGRLVVWSHPAFANSCIYVRNDKEIICVNLRREDVDSSDSDSSEKQNSETPKK